VGRQLLHAETSTGGPLSSLNPGDMVLVPNLTSVRMNCACRYVTVSWRSGSLCRRNKSIALRNKHKYVTSSI